MALYPPTFQSYIGYRAFISFYRKRGTLPVEPFSNDTICSVMPDYFGKIRPDMEEISHTISNMRASENFDFDSSSDMDIYIDAIEKLKNHHLEVIKKINVLVEYEKKSKNGDSLGRLKRLF